MSTSSKSKEINTNPSNIKSEPKSSGNDIPKENIHPDVRQIFIALDSESKGYITRNQLENALTVVGLEKTDVRLKQTYARLLYYHPNDEIALEEFNRLINSNPALIQKAIKREVIVPNFQDFCAEIKILFDQTKKNTSGNVADYIPQLKRVPENKFSVALCTIDGQVYSLGDAEDHFVVQSTCKPINYCLALEEHSEDVVHKYIGREPSGRGFNELTLNRDGKPHNPMINAGAIMSCSLIKPNLDTADKFDYVIENWTALSGDVRPNFNNSVYLSERKTADRNFALGYFMREKNAFPPHTSLIETLEFYFQCCSIEVTSQQMATVAATLANSGICPVTQKRIFNAQTVKNCLSLMYSCGMYDFSGEFAFTVGLPAKSGVSGALMIIVPGVMGVCIWSPRLDVCGNSVRGVEFSKRLVNRFNFHNYDDMLENTNKIDPTLNRTVRKREGATALCWAASVGDIHEIQRLLARGISLNSADYDGRTALHLASSTGHTKVVKYLLRKGATAAPVDRWGNLPIDEARKAGHTEIVTMLEKYQHS